MTTHPSTITPPLLEAFKTHIAEIQDLRSTQGLLGWDMETFMPAKGVDIRASQSATLSKIAHQMLTDPKVGDWLAALQAPDTYATLSRVDQAHVREVQRQYDQETKLPVSLVQALSQATAKAHSIWVNARKQQDFQAFAPTLAELIKLNQQVAECFGYQASPYDALLDQYEPGLTAATFQQVADALQGPMSALIQKIQASPHQPPMALLADKTFDIAVQNAFTLEVLTAMGFDFEAGRQDEADHPFTMGMGPHDVRLTTRYMENDVVSALFSSIHEGGHGLYEQGIDPSLSRTFLDGGASLGIHESPNPACGKTKLAAAWPFGSTTTPACKYGFRAHWPASTPTRFIG
jgi:carboxypeptidase Taq